MAIIIANLTYIWPATEIGPMNFNKRSRQRYNKWVCTFLPQHDWEASRCCK